MVSIVPGGLSSYRCSPLSILSKKKIIINFFFLFLSLASALHILYIESTRAKQWKYFVVIVLLLRET